MGRIRFLVSREIITTVFISMMVASAGLAAPLSPELVEQLRATGQLERHARLMKQAIDRGVNQPGDLGTQLQVRRENRLAKSGASALTEPDTLHVLVILVDFSDNEASAGSVFGTQEMFDSLLFSHGLNPTGSMTEFYEENSWGTVTVTGEIVGWLRMPEPYAYYVDGQRGFGEYPQNAQKLAEDACVVADPYVDFTQYDITGDGYVDGIFVVHAGPGYEDTGNTGAIHSHVWSVQAELILDGVQIGLYSMEPEESGTGGLSPIGVYCHEYGHVLGLPDLYDYDYDTDGIGYWSLMAGGSWAYGGRRPVHYDAWCKSKLGWLDLIEITENTAGLTAPAIEFSPVAYRIWKNGQVGPEYFIIANRQRYSFDRSVPGRGLLIYHVDETMAHNDDNWHRLVDIEQADGRYDLNVGGAGDGSDPWYAPQATHFDDLTIPNSKAYDSSATYVAMFNISEIDSIMSFDAEVNLARPHLMLQNFMYSDDAGGDGDGLAEGGETVEVYLTMENIWAFADDVELRMSIDDPYVTLLDSVAYLGAAPPHVPITNNPGTLRFSVRPDVISRTIDVILSITAGGGSFAQQHLHQAILGTVQFLIVDQDGEPGWSYDPYFAAMLDSLRLPYDIYNRGVDGPLDPSILPGYPSAIWFTGDTREGSVTLADIERMTEFLDSGGRLLLTGQDIVEHMHELGADDFLRNYLHVEYAGTASLPIMDGVDGDPISDGLTVLCNSSGGAANQQSMDILTATTGGEAIFTYYQSSDVAGVRFDGDFRTVTLGFGLEAIADLFPGYTKRHELMSRIWGWWIYIEPGDMDGDGVVTPLDVVWLINYLFRSGSLKAGTSADINGNCIVDIADAVWLVNYVFRSGPAPLEPCSIP